MVQIHPHDFQKTHNWEGFTNSYLRWVAVKRGNYENWKYGLLIRHELAHNHLGLTPFSRFKKHEVFGLFRLIIRTFKNGKKRLGTIPVPLSSVRVRNKFEKQWAIVANILRESTLVEEVFAVRSSLLESKDVGNIDPKKLKWETRRYKRAYGEYIDGFKKAYNALDFMAGEIGEDAARGLIYSAFETLYPTATFLTILFFLCGVDHQSSGNNFRWTLPMKKTRALASLSTQEACNAFGNLIEETDPDDSLYGRRAMRIIVLKLERLVARLSQYTGGDFINLLINPSPTTFLFSYYSDDIQPFALIDLSTLEVEGKVEQIIEEYYGNYAVFLEAILEQLTHGIGLLCPFWIDNIGCCCPQYKALLENVWSCTKPDDSCDWKRMGCLC
jgi:hypothetical protein